MRGAVCALCRLCNFIVTLRTQPRHVWSQTATIRRHCSRPNLHAAGRHLNSKVSKPANSFFEKHTVTAHAQVQAAPRPGTSDLGQVSLRDVEERLGPLSTELTVFPAFEQPQSCSLGALHTSMLSTCDKSFALVGCGCAVVGSSSGSCVPC